MPLSIVTNITAKEPAMTTIVALFTTLTNAEVKRRTKPCQQSIIVSAMVACSDRRHLGSTVNHVALQHAFLDLIFCCAALVLDREKTGRLSEKNEKCLRVMNWLGEKTLFALLFLPPQHKRGHTVAKTSKLSPPPPWPAEVQFSPFFFFLLESTSFVPKVLLLLRDSSVLFFIFLAAMLGFESEQKKSWKIAYL